MQAQTTRSPAVPNGEESAHRAPALGSAAPQTAASLTCQIVSEFAELERLRAEWEELQARSSADEPMLSLDWLLPWWRVYGAGTGRELRVGLFRDAERLVGLAPLQGRRYWYRRCLPFQRLEPLGADVDEQDGVSSDYLNLIVERGQEERVARALAHELAQGTFGPWDEFVLPDMDGEGVVPPLLVEAFTRCGFEATCVTTDAAPYVCLPASWDEYVRSLGRKKNKVQRSLRVFDEWAGSEARYHRATTPAELDEGKRILIALHTGRWESAGLTGAFRSTRFAAFHDAVMPALFQRNALELLWLTVRGEPVAALYQIVWRNKTYFYQSGRRLDFAPGIAPGIVLIGHALRQSIEAKRREFDFLRGVATYKTQLAPALRPIVQVRAYPSSLRERFRQWFERGIASTRGIRQATRSAFRWLGRRGNP